MPVLSNLTDFERRGIEHDLMTRCGCDPATARVIVAEVLEPVLAHHTTELRGLIGTAAEALEKWNGVGDDEHSLVIATIARNLRKATS